MASEMQRGTVGVEGCLSLPRVSRFSCNTRDTLVLVRHRETPLGYIVLFVPCRGIVAHFECAYVCATIISRKCSLSMYNEYNVDTRDRECLTL